MSQKWEPHPDEESLEAYAMGWLTGERANVVETHLLLCEACRQEVSRTECFVAALRDSRPTQPVMMPLPADARRPRREKN